MTRFTPRQGEFLAFIHRYTERHGIAPSFDELATYFGITSPGVNGMVKTLESRGLISRVPGAARTLRVEVPVEELPDIGYGRTPRRAKSPPPSPRAQPSSLAVLGATAVLDAVMPLLIERGATGDDVVKAVMAAAARVAKTLTKAGIHPEESAAAARRIAAEASRWQPDGRGVTIPRRVWRRRD